MHVQPRTNATNHIVIQKSIPMKMSLKKAGKDRVIPRKTVGTIYCAPRCTRTILSKLLNYLQGSGTVVKVC